jgi:SAM-dependent methyltransferase
LVRTTASSESTTLIIEYDEQYFTERNAYVTREAEFRQVFETLTDQFQPWAKPGGKLLDVGCGAGYLLQTASGRGFDVSGCDVSAWAGKHGSELGFKVRVGLLEDLAYPAATFDVVVCNHTLEHVSSPVSFLQEIKRILVPDGILVIGVPNFDSLMSKIMRDRWGSLLPEQHLWHFTPKTLRQMIEHSGFSTLHINFISATQAQPKSFKQITLKLIRMLGSAIHKDESMTLIAKNDREAHKIFEDA